MRRERENLQKEIERLREEQNNGTGDRTELGRESNYGGSNLFAKMNTQQAKLYQLIQDKIRKPS